MQPNRINFQGAVPSMPDVDGLSHYLATAQKTNEAHYVTNVYTTMASAFSVGLTHIVRADSRYPIYQAPAVGGFYLLGKDIAFNNGESFQGTTLHYIGEVCRRVVLDGKSIAHTAFDGVRALGNDYIGVYLQNRLQYAVAVQRASQIGYVYDGKDDKFSTAPEKDSLTVLLEAPEWILENALKEQQVFLAESIGEAQAVRRIRMDAEYPVTDFDGQLRIEMDSDVFLEAMYPVMYHLHYVLKPHGIKTLIAHRWFDGKIRISIPTDQIHEPLPAFELLARMDESKLHVLNRDSD